MNLSARGQSNIDLKQIVYVIAIAQHGSISGAASHLNVAQPSISESIAKLERRLGIQLVIRRPRGIQLTEAGAVFAKRGDEILHELQHLMEYVHELSSEPRGQLATGLPQALSSLLSVPLLETVYAEYPKIELSISEAMSGDVISWLDEGRLDLGCVYEPLDCATFACDLLLDEEMFLVTAPDNWHGEISESGLALDTITIKELADLPLVSTTVVGRGARRSEEKISRLSGMSLKVVAALDSASMMIEMVKRASAYAVLPHSAVHREVAKGQLALVRIADHEIRRQVYLARRLDREVSHAMSLVQDLIKLVLMQEVERCKLHGIKGQHA